MISKPKILARAAEYNGNHCRICICYNSIALFEIKYCWVISLDLLVTYKIFTLLYRLIMRADRGEPNATDIAIVIFHKNVTIGGFFLISSSSCLFPECIFKPWFVFFVCWFEIASSLLSGLKDYVGSGLVSQHHFLTDFSQPFFWSSLLLFGSWFSRFHSQTCSALLHRSWLLSWLAWRASPKAVSTRPQFSSWYLKIHPQVFLYLIQMTLSIYLLFCHLTNRNIRWCLFMQWI